MRAMKVERRSRAAAWRACSASAPVSAASSWRSSVSTGGASSEEMDVDLGAEVLPQLDGRSQAALGRRIGHVGRVLHVLRPDADDDGSPQIVAERGMARDRLVVHAEAMAGEAHVEHALLLVHRGLDEIHRRAADEAGDEQVPRARVEHLGRVELLHDAEAHDGDEVAQGHRLGLVVRDVDHGHAQVALDAPDLGAHLHAQLGVEVREGLVHEEHLRLAHDRPPHRHPLALPAGEVPRLLAQVVTKPEGLRGRGDALVDLVLRRASQLQPEAHVVVDRHVRVEGVVLEDHRDVAVLGRQVVDDPVADARPRR